MRSWWTNRSRRDAPVEPAGGFRLCMLSSPDQYELLWLILALSLDGHLLWWFLMLAMSCCCWETFETFLLIVV